MSLLNAQSADAASLDVPNIQLVLLQVGKNPANHDRISTMVLSDRDIHAYIKSGKNKINPLKIEHIRPAAIDLTLHENIRVFRNNSHTHIDVKKV